MPKKKRGKSRARHKKVVAKKAPSWVTPERGGRRGRAKPRRGGHKPGGKSRYIDIRGPAGAPGTGMRLDSQSEARIERFLAWAARMIQGR
jgi:hypothetical protein